MKTLINSTIHAGGLALLALTSLAANAGGVSGGGGGTVPAHPVSQEQIKEMIAANAWELVPFFRRFEIEKRAGKTESCQDAVCTKLFGGPKSIYNVLQEAEVEFQNAGDCLAPDGTPHDGAAPGKSPVSICLSLRNLSQKLGATEARAQTMALMAHEYSHLLGTTEDEAVAIQDRALTAFQAHRRDELEKMLEQDWRGNFDMSDAYIKDEFLKDPAKSFADPKTADTAKEVAQFYLDAGNPDANFSLSLSALKLVAEALNHITNVQKGVKDQATFVQELNATLALNQKLEAELSNDAIRLPKAVEAAAAVNGALPCMGYFFTNESPPMQTELAFSQEQISTAASAHASVALVGGQSLEIRADLTTDATIEVDLQNGANREELFMQSWPAPVSIGTATFTVPLEGRNFKLADGQPVQELIFVCRWY